MGSILTNNGAMVALRTLKGINKNLGQVQDQISTGLKVGKSKDDAAVFAISEVMRSDQRGFEAISEALSLGSSTVSVASAAAKSIGDTLKDIKTKIVSANQDNVNKDVIQDEIVSMVAGINSVVNAAQFNGMNLIDGSTTAPVEILASLDRDASNAVTAGKISIDSSLTDLSGSGGILDDLASIDVTADAAAALASIDVMISATAEAQAVLGTAENRLENQEVFMGKLTDAFKSGIGTLVDANLEEASARLQALQVQQQLGTQALSIANQAPQSILSLFR